MSAIPEETYKRPIGHRFDPEICEIVDAVTGARIEELKEEVKTAEDDTPSRLLSRIYNFRSEVHPSTSYNCNRRNPEYHKARRLTVEKLDAFLAAMGWTNRYFLELCLDANRSFTPVQCLRGTMNEGWTTLSWPNPAMKHMAAILDRTTVEKCAVIERVIREHLAKCYPQLVAELDSESEEYGRNEVLMPAYLAENPEEYIPEIKRENMADRILAVLKFKYNDAETLSSLCRENGIFYEPNRTNRQRHYWTFRIQEMDVLCRTFNLSPHWVFYGDREIPLLAEKAETERIMDLFQLLPDDLQIVIERAAELSADYVRKEDC